jgi:hypothetical protein
MKTIFAAILMIASLPLSAQVTVPLATTTSPGLVQPGTTMSIANGVLNCSVGVTYNSSTGQFLDNGTPIATASFGSITLTQNPPPASGSYFPVFVNGVQTWETYSAPSSGSSISAPQTFSVSAATTAGGSRTMYVEPIPIGTGCSSSTGVDVALSIPTATISGNQPKTWTNGLQSAPPAGSSITVYGPFIAKGYVLNCTATSSQVGQVAIEIDNISYSNGSLPAGTWTYRLVN